MNATFQGDTPSKLLSFETLEETENTAVAEAISYDWTSQTASPSAAAPTSAAASVAKETPVSGPSSKAMTPSLQEAGSNPIIAIRTNWNVIPWGLCVKDRSQGDKGQAEMEAVPRA
ncbi:MAG: hypothetical protein ACKPKO_55140, partial [Candidatus Fonsibacter sp.]